MADRILINYAEMDGSYGGVPFFDEMSTEASVTLTEVSFTKTANREVWFSGELTFFLTIDNSEGENDMTGVVIKDELDTTMFAYVRSSVAVEVDGNAIAGFTADYTAPVLTVTITDTIPAGETAVISFRGTKVPATP